MNEQTGKLLEECNTGSKMALNAIDQLDDYIDNEDLQKLVQHYKEEHEKIEEKSSELLRECGKEEKEPGALVTIYGKVATEVKMMIKDDSSQIAKIMMDGCNMGIQNISKCRNQYTEASSESLAVADSLIKIDEKFLKDMKGFL